MSNYHMPLHLIDTVIGFSEKEDANLQNIIKYRIFACFSFIRKTGNCLPSISVGGKQKDQESSVLKTVKINRLLK